jgi:predicted house-cleaning noncanonical NTP pyrophosphatase (MazG superfamily)
MKLIRDKYVDKIPSEQLRTNVTDGVFNIYLEKKLTEELTELEDSDYVDAEEYADVIEVLYAMAKRNGISRDLIEKIRLDKLERLGGFENGILLKY